MIYFYGYKRPGYGYVLSELNNPNGLALGLNLGLFAVAYNCTDDVKNMIIHIKLYGTEATDRHHNIKIVVPFI